MRVNVMLFLSKTRPLATTTASGEFVLQLHTFNRIKPLQVDSWLVFWSGPQAQTFWGQHQHNLVPGCAIEVSADCVRPHVVRGCAPEIHARVTSMQLAATPETRRATAAEES